MVSAVDIDIVYEYAASYYIVARSRFVSRKIWRLQTFARATAVVVSLHNTLHQHAGEQHPQLANVYFPIL